MKINKQTALTLALGSALAMSLTAAPVSAAENPFAARSMEKGYMVAGADKAREGKCGGMKSADDEAANKKMMKEGKCGEGKCGTKNMKEGKCGGAKKAQGDARKAEEGKTTADKAMEGKCGGMKGKEGKCGGK